MNDARFIVVALFACLSLVQAGEPPIGIEQVAKALDIPSNSIRRTEKTPEVVAKHGESVYSANLFEFESEMPASMQVIVTKGHFLLTDALRGKLESEPALIEKVDLEDGGTAFVGTEGVGPGAEGYVAIAHLPSQNVDFRLRVMISNDGANSDDVSRFSTLRSSLLLKKALRSLAISSSAKLSEGASAFSVPTVQVTKRAESPESTKDSAQQHAPQEQKPTIWKLFTLAMAGAFTLLFVVFYWLKRNKVKKQEKSHSK